MATKISLEKLVSMNPKAHRELLDLNGLERVIDLEESKGRFCAIARFSGDGESDADITLHYGHDTGFEWLEF